MKKTLKMSLVAAVAVAGISSSVSAKPLSEAIQNTDISGMLRYRFERKSADKGTDANIEHVKAVLGLKSKVNDKVTAAVKFVAAQTQGEEVEAANPIINVAKFTYGVNSTTSVTAGLMELATPWTDAADGARANGVLLSTKVGGMTIAAAKFRDSTMGGDKTASINPNDLAALAVIGKAGPASFQAWYLTISAANDNLDPDGDGNAPTVLSKGGDAVALLVNAKVGPATIDASYASLEGDDENELKKQTLTKAIVTVPAGGVTVVAGMAKGGSDGDLVTFDPDAKVGFESWNIRAGQGEQLDLSATTMAVVAPVAGLKLKAQYTSAEWDKNTNTKGLEADEMLLQAGFSLSKNFGGYLRYATVDFNDKAGDGDFNRCRLELKYTF